MTAPAPTVLFDFFGTLVHYSASRTEQGYHRTLAVLHETGVDLSYQGFLDTWSRASEVHEQVGGCSTNHPRQAEVAPESVAVSSRVASSQRKRSSEISPGTSRNGNGQSLAPGQGHRAAYLAESGGVVHPVRVSVWNL